MNNRSQSSSAQETSDNYYPRNLERAVVQTSAVTFFLGSAAYPLEYLANRKSMGMPITFSSFFSSAFLRANYSTILPGLKKSYELCFMKNVAVSNHGRVTEYIGEPEPHRTGYYNIMAPSMGLAFLDTLATQFSINTRLQYDAGKKKPVLNWPDYIKFAKVGAPTRYTANFLNILGCMGATNILKRPVNRFLPEDQFGVFLPSAVTTVMAGTIVGFGNHGLKVINNRRVIAYDFEKKLSPGFMETFLNVAKKEGVRGFSKGSLMSASVTVMAYSIINSVDAIADYYYGNPEFSLFERDKNSPSKANIPQSIQPVSIPTNTQPVKIQIEDVSPQLVNQPEAPTQTTKIQDEMKNQTNSAGHSSGSPRLFVLPPKQAEPKTPVVEEVKTNRNTK